MNKSGTHPAEFSAASFAAGGSAADFKSVVNRGMDFRSTVAGTSGLWQRAHSKIRRQDLAEVTAQLSIMTKSGIDVATALHSLASQCQKPALHAVLNDIHRSVMAGSSLSDALRCHDDVFDAAFIATVAAGEASGSIADVLGQLTLLQRTELRNRRTMRTLMTYPVLLLFVSLSVIGGLVVFVLPRFADIFDQYDVALPLITELMISLATELKSRWWLWGPGAVASIAGFLWWRSTPGGRARLDHFWLHTAVLKDVARAKQTGRLCGLFGLMLSNGVPILEALKLTENALSNIYFRILLQKLADAVTNGRTLQSVLRDAEIIPHSARDMLSTAEETGNVAAVSKMLGEYYEEEAEAKMRHLVGLIEPALTVGMGVVVAIVVLAVMLPVFDLSSVAHGG